MEFNPDVLLETRRALIFENDQNNYNNNNTHNNDCFVDSTTAAAQDNRHHYYNNSGSSSNNSGTDSNVATAAATPDRWVFGERDLLRNLQLAVEATTSNNNNNNNGNGNIERSSASSINNNHSNVCEENDGTASSSSSDATGPASTSPRLVATSLSALAAAVTVKQMTAFVDFRCHRELFTLTATAANKLALLREGEYVVVQGDRGIDIGRFVCFYRRPWRPTAVDAGVKRLFRPATEGEVAHMHTLDADANELMRFLFELQLVALPSLRHAPHKATPFTSTIYPIQSVARDLDFVNVELQFAGYSYTAQEERDMAIVLDGNAYSTTTQERKSVVYYTSRTGARVLHSPLSMFLHQRYGGRVWMHDANRKAADSGCWVFTPTESELSLLHNQIKEAVAATPRDFLAVQAHWTWRRVIKGPAVATSTNTAVSTLDSSPPQPVAVFSRGRPVVLGAAAAAAAVAAGGGGASSVVPSTAKATPPSSIPPPPKWENTWTDEKEEATTATVVAAPAPTAAATAAAQPGEEPLKLRLNQNYTPGAGRRVPVALSAAGAEPTAVVAALSSIISAVPDEAEIARRRLALATRAAPPSAPPFTFNSEYKSSGRPVVAVATAALPPTAAPGPSSSSNAVAPKSSSSSSSLSSSSSSSISESESSEKGVASAAPVFPEAKQLQQEREEQQQQQPEPLLPAAVVVVVESSSVRNSVENTPKTVVASETAPPSPIAAVAGGTAATAPTTTAASSASSTPRLAESSDGGAILTQQLLALSMQMQTVIVSQARIIDQLQDWIATEQARKAQVAPLPRGVQWQ